MLLETLLMASNGAGNMPPSTIGDAYQGGYYGGNVTMGQTTYAIVVAPKATGESSQSIYNTDDYTNGATSNTDSAANTSFLYGTTNSLAAAWAKGLVIGNFSDWQLPAIAVMNALYQNIRPSLTTIATAFRNGGSEAFSDSQFYWSSTTHDYLRDDSYTTGGDPIYDWVATENYRLANYITPEVLSEWTENADTYPTPAWNACMPYPTSPPADAAGSPWNDNWTALQCSPVVRPPPNDHHSTDFGEGYQPARYLNSTYYTCDYGKYWEAYTTNSYQVVGYTPVENHEVYTQVYEAYASKFGASQDTTSLNKQLVHLVRAIRLVQL